MSNEATAKVLVDVSAMQAEIAALKAQLAKKSQVRYKVSEKGAVSVYGMGRFPVTLYQSQWDTLFTHVDRIKAFLAANKAKLSTKAE